MSNSNLESNSDSYLVSVITVCKDDQEGLTRTLKSVFEQKFSDYELIIIEGGSQANYIDLLNQQSHPSAKLIIEPDEGIYHAMNKGVAHSQGEWLIFMNAGDSFASPEALANAASEMSDDADVVFSDWIYRETSELAKADIVKLNVRHQAVIYRKNLHDIYGNYIVGKRVTISDYLFFLSIAHKKWKYCKYPLAICDKAGASSNPRHFYQRIAAELIFGKRTVLNSCCIFLLYPFYRIIKRNVLRLR
ncbi:MAG TPA: glycosyltransferase [Methylophilaceae bacterium]|nr:glycosyltransferase [Methylophilaceae bacterium]